MFLLNDFYRTSLVDICLNIPSLRLEENIVILGQHHNSPINLNIGTWENYISGSRISQPDTRWNYTSTLLTIYILRHCQYARCLKARRC